MPKSVILRARVDQPLWDALLCSARAAGIPVADLVRDTLRAAHDRRARICASLGLPRDASDTELLTELQHEMITLTPVEQATARQISDVDQALSFTAARVATKRKAKARGAQPGAVGPDGLYPFEREDAAKIKDPEARARFVAKRLQRRSSSKPAPAPATKPAPTNGSAPPKQRNAAEPQTRTVYFGASRPIGGDK